MSRGSSDVLDEIKSYAEDAAKLSRDGLFELAKLMLSSIERLTSEAWQRLRYESNCKKGLERSQDE